MRLNIACGPNIFPGWINTDRDDVEETYLRHLRGLQPDQMHGWSDEQKNHVKALNAGNLQFFQWDLRRGFPMYPDGSVDAVYGGQMIEHLNPIHEVPKFLAECHRMLRPGGRIRLTTPSLLRLLNDYVNCPDDLAKYAAEQPAYYAGALPEDQLAYIMYGAGGTLEKYEGHQHLYTPRALSMRLKGAGFVAYEGDRSAVFWDCIDHGMSHSFAIEAVK